MINRRSLFVWIKYSLVEYLFRFLNLGIRLGEHFPHVPFFFCLSLCKLTKATAYRSHSNFGASEATLNLIIYFVRLTSSTENIENEQKIPRPRPKTKLSALAVYIWRHYFKHSICGCKETENFSKTHWAQDTQDTLMLQWKFTYGRISFNWCCLFRSLNMVVFLFECREMRNWETVIHLASSFSLICSGHLIFLRAVASNSWYFILFFGWL